MRAGTDAPALTVLYLGTAVAVAGLAVWRYATTSSTRAVSR